MTTSRTGMGGLVSRMSQQDVNNMKRNFLRHQLNQLTSAQPMSKEYVRKDGHRYLVEVENYEIQKLFERRKGFTRPAFISWIWFLNAWFLGGVIAYSTYELSWGPRFTLFTVFYVYVIYTSLMFLLVPFVFYFYEALRLHSKPQQYNYFELHGQNMQFSKHTHSKETNPNSNNHEVSSSREDSPYSVDEVRLYLGMHLYVFLMVAFNITLLAQFQDNWGLDIPAPQKPDTVPYFIQFHKIHLLLLISSMSALYTIGQAVVMYWIHPSYLFQPSKLETGKVVMYHYSSLELDKKKDI